MGALTAGALGVALLVCGAGFGSPSLFVPGVALSGLAAIAAVWVQLARPTRLLRESGPTRVIEDEPYPLRLRAVGARMPPPGGQLCDDLLERPLEVGPGWSGAYATEVRLTGRGRRRLAPARLVVRDPLGLRELSVASEEPGDLLVLPRIEPIVATATGPGGGQASGIAGLVEATPSTRIDARAIELEVDGLRAYREGSPASRIHWPAVARSGELIERRLVAGGDATPVVALDASAPAGTAELDAAVRAAASLCLALAKAGGCGILLPGARRAVEVEPDLRTWPGIHARLALVEPGGAPPAVARAVRAAAVFWVTAAARPATPAALRGGGARYLVAPAGTAGAGAAGRPEFTVAGCEGRRVGARVRPPARRAAA